MENHFNILNQFEKLKENEPFSIPEHYFDSVSEHVQDKIAQQAEHSLPVGILKSRKIQVASIFVTGVVIISFLVFRNMSNAANNRQSTAIELTDYVESQAMLLDDATLANEVISLNEAEKVQNDTINYLINNNIEAEEIINAL